MRRQIGCERVAGAAAVVHATPTRRAISGARFALFLTVAAWATYVVEQVGRYLSQPFSVRGTIEAGVYLLLVTSLTASASAYLLARLGHLSRARDHRRTPRVLLDELFESENPTVTVIVPSYREDARVIYQTLLSAALQEYPSLRVALLVDDPPDLADPEHRRLLEAARDVPVRIAAMLEGPRQRSEELLHRFETSTPSGKREADVDDLASLADVYDEAAGWIASFASAHEIVDHTDAFLAIEVLGRLEHDLTTTATALREAADAGAAISTARLRHLYRRLVWIFRAELTSFERKRFASLTHEPNKAANLNSYIGLMGGRYRLRETRGGTILLPVRSGTYDLEVPDADYVLTLDADSTLLPEYCLRLVAFLQQPENARVAVAQTPYSAYRGAPTRLERIAGATTDLQHIVHQGLTRYGATFWVGANAVLRKAALDEIGIEEQHNGFTTHRYISDRTPIEDTESSIDLRVNGWRLVNYPERLSYSATPPDLGSLCIQRERWSNGGLVILPKLATLWRSSRDRSLRGRLVEAFLRTNYLASIAWASLGLWVLLAYPFDQRLLSAWAVLTAAPYFVAIANDLRRCGYRRRDVLSLYGLNLMLLAVNTVGVVKSLAQAIGGHKVAFARTPKVRNRTVTPLAYVAVPYVIAVWSAITLLDDLAAHRYLHASFASVNALLATYAMVTLHGVRNTVVDLLVDVRERLYRKERVAPVTERSGDWATVLYHGPAATGERINASAASQALAALDEERAGATPEIMLEPASGVIAPTRDVGEVAGRDLDPGDDVAAADRQALGEAIADALTLLGDGATVRLRVLDGSIVVDTSNVAGD
jgi:cellulose synthase/poly-beta-1,6-N-acetylglucosamine synthase-like glycosyltransferase